MQYERFIQERFRIVNKDGVAVPFVVHPLLSETILQKETARIIILKPRKIGFSSTILGRFTTDFILRENSRSVVIADNKENGIALLDREKYYLQAYKAITGVEVPLKYNSKNELVNPVKNTRYFVGTAENAEFGRSQDITNLHFSEAAFYPDFERLRASALQATVNNAFVVVETTANSFNDFKMFWDDSILNLTGFDPKFFSAELFYTPEFLADKRKELGRLYDQEFPSTPEIAFLSSGDPFFSIDSLKEYMGKVKQPMLQDQIYL